MSYLIINNIDVSNLVKSLKVGYEHLVSDESGRNANGDMVIDLKAVKRKLQVVFRAMDNTEMSRLLNAIQDYVFYIDYRDPRTGGMNSFECCLHAAVLILPQVKLNLQRWLHGAGTTVRRSPRPRAEKPQQDGRRGKITFRVKPHACQRAQEVMDVNS